MKKLTLMLCVALLTTALTGCNNAAKTELAKTCESESSTLPIMIGDSDCASCVSISYDRDNNVVTLGVKVRDRFAPIFACNEENFAAQTLKPFIVYRLSRTLLDDIIAANASMTCDLHVRTSGDNVNTVRFTTDELRQMLDDTAIPDDGSTRSALNAWMKNKEQIAKYPSVDESTITCSIWIKDGFMIVYGALLTEEEVDDDQMDSALTEMKNTLHESFISSFAGPEGRELGRCMTELSYGLKYIVLLSANNHAYTVTFSPAEIAEMFEAAQQAN